MTAGAHQKTDDLGPQIDAMLADAELRADSAPAPSPAAGSDDDFQSEMHGAVGDAEALAATAARKAAQAAPAGSPDTAQPTPATIDELDEQLADSAPDEDDIPTPEPDHPAPSDERQTLDEMREEVAQALTAAPMEDEPTPEPSADEAPEPAPEPEPEPEPVIAQAPDEEPALPSPQTPDPTPARRSPLLALLRFIPLVLAWPLSFLPPAARDQIGWLALVTLFNASAVWVYLLLRH